MVMVGSLLLAALAVGVGGQEQKKPPNIVFIVIDDLGWNDAPWNNPDSLAVHLGRYAREGVVLDRHYVHSKCSPSRAALLTGRYAWTMGRQRGAIERFQPTGLSTKYKILPEYLKAAGYKTHAIGKWHLGFCNNDYLPTRRGFDSFFGMLQQSTHYRSRMITCSSFKFRKEMVGYDLRRNESVSHDYTKRFAPNMYSKEARKVIREHDPSGPPLFLYFPLMSIHTPHVGSPPKRFRSLYDSSGSHGFQSHDDLRDIMLASVDFSLHKVFVDLEHSGMMANTVVVVTTDNGGGPWDSNTPLKGTKETMYEGGIRGAAFIHSPLLGRRGTYGGLMHMADWVPTLLSMAGVPAPGGLDGRDQWQAIRNNLSSPRESIVHNIDQDRKQGTWQATISSGQWKLIWGQDYLLKKRQPQFKDRALLYDVYQDPGERRDLSNSQTQVVERLKAEVLSAMNSSYVPADWPKGTKKGWPSNFGGIISPGWCLAK